MVGGGGFRVATPCLEGFAASLESAAKGDYPAISDHAYLPNLFVEHVASSDGDLLGVLGLLLDDLRELNACHRTTFQRLGTGLGKSGGIVREAATAYEGCELENIEGFLDIEHIPGDFHGMVRALEGVFSAPHRDPFAGAEMPTEEDLYRLLQRTEKRMDEVAGSITGAIDGAFQEVFGVSLLKMFVTPLLGQWWLLPLSACVYRNGGRAVEVVQSNVDAARSVLMPEYWHGEAADACGGHLDDWEQVFGKHAAVLRASGHDIQRIAETLNRDANAIADGLEAIVDIVLTIVGPGGVSKLASAIRSGISIFSDLKKYVESIFYAGYHLAEAVDTALGDFKDHIRELKALRPPGPADLPPGDPEEARRAAIPWGN